MRTFGQEIKDQRLLMGLSQEEVAERAGTHKGYICGIENGKVNPPAVTVTKRLAKVLRLRTERLLIISWIDKAPKEIRLRLRTLLGDLIQGI